MLPFDVLVSGDDHGLVGPDGPVGDQGQPVAVRHHDTLSLLILLPKVQGEELNLAVLFWFLVKSDAISDVKFYKVPETHGHV